MATATLKFDFTRIASRIRWSGGTVVTSGSAYGQSFITTSNATMSGLTGQGRVDSIDVTADGCPVSSSGGNGSQYSATVVVSCGTFSVSGYFSGMSSHGS